MERNGSKNERIILSIMKIGIDARLYGAQKNRGIGRYIEKLLTHLQMVDNTNQYYIFLLPTNYDLFTVTAKNFHKVKVAIPWYSWLEQLWWPFILYFYSFDLVHFTHFNVPIMYRRRYIITLHDLIMTHYTDDRSTTKNKYIYKLKIYLARIMINLTARKAKTIICPSQYTQADVIKHLGVKKENCRVIYEAVDDNKEFLFEKLDDYKINAPFFLYVGAAYPHKNLERLIKGFLKFDKSSKYNLVLVGRVDYFYSRLKEKYKQQDNVIFTGEVNDRQLSTLYSQALAFVFPSLIEGFGLPPLEAMQNNCPVISSNSSCLPEILGEAALYFNPTNEEEIADSLAKIINNQSLVATLKIKGKKRLQNYSWQKMAKETNQIYKQFCE